MVNCVRGKYIYMYWYSTAVCIRLYTRYDTSIFLFGGMHIRARFTAVYAYIYIYMCNYSGMYVVVVVVFSH